MFKGSVSGQAGGSCYPVSRPKGVRVNSHQPVMSRERDAAGMENISDHRRLSFYKTRGRVTAHGCSTSFLDFSIKTQALDWVVFASPLLNQKTLSFKQITRNFTMSEFLRSERRKKTRVRNSACGQTLSPPEL